ncbi:hypothetical protein [Streptomyces sp. NPDC094149]|uniref:hypothetical protein n=1 Tax=Streptomyces sp. NPDC094149 TaxID=3155079 RepID=UPI00332211F1
MTTALYLAGPLLVCGGVISGFIYTFFAAPKPKQPEQPFDEVEARMDAAIANTDHPGRRAALTLARHNRTEQP